MVFEGVPDRLLHSGMPRRGRAVGSIHDSVAVRIWAVGEDRNVKMKFRVVAGALIVILPLLPFATGGATANKSKHPHLHNEAG